jgi:hypothetical protein
MRSAVVITIATLLFAGASQAAVLRMAWAGTDGDTWQMSPGDTAVLETWVDLIEGEEVINVFYANERVPATQIAVSTSVPGWVERSTHGGLGAIGQQVSVGTPAAASPVFGPASFLAAEQTIQLDETTTPGDLIEITYWHLTVGLVDLVPDIFPFAPDLAGTVPGFYTYGAGSPGVAAPGLGESPRQPLFIEVVPEPASFFLLALGMMGLLRGRRA